MASRHFFRVSEAVVLALHSAAILAENPGRLVSARELARDLEASEHHLAKVMQRLVRKGIARSTRGPGGGFRIADESGSATLLDVYEAIEGEMTVTGCLFDKPVCGGRLCMLGGLISNLEEQTRSFLASTRLSDVVNRRRKESICSRSFQ